MLKLLFKGILGDYQKENAALALSLVDAWLSADPHKSYFRVIIKKLLVGLKVC
jgi:hypothetical protein